MIAAGFRYKTVLNGKVRQQGIAKNTLCAEWFEHVCRFFAANANFSVSPVALRMGLINSAGFTGVSINDTMTSHVGWTENTNYTGSNRSAMGACAAITKSTTPVQVIGHPCVQMSTGGATLRGFFLTTGVTKGTTTGQLFAAAGLPEDLVVLASELVIIDAYLTLNF